MGGTARQFNKMYIDYKQQFKKPIHIVASLMPQEFSDDDFIATFKRLYPYMWSDLEKQYLYWHGKNEYLIKHGKKSRYNFRKPYNFILDCSYHVRKNLRKSHERTILSDGEKAKIEAEILADSLKKVKKKQNKLLSKLHYVQEIEPQYTQAFIDHYFNTNDLHERLEIIRELSKYKSDKIIKFFYKVNT